jgi:septum formation protein
VRLILGSGSPRRLELLAQIGAVPDAVTSPDIDETPRGDEFPRGYCARMAREKLDAIAADPEDIVLCADTTVAIGRRIMGKPADAGEAADFLMRMGGRRHRESITIVKMKRLCDIELNGYLATEDWRGKAGGYGIQGPAGAFISWIQGSYTGVMGLPVHETAQMLQAAGYPLYGEKP